MSSFGFTFKLRPGDTSRIEGVARVEDDGVHVEWRRETEFFPRQTQVKHLVFPFGDIQSTEYHQTWLRARLVIMVRRMELVNDVIGVHPGGGLLLVVPRDQREAARKFASIVALRLSEAALARVRDPLAS